MESFTKKVEEYIDSGEFKDGIIHGADREYVSFTFGELRVYGSLRPTGGKTTSLKERMKIPQETWVCHFYYTDTNDVYIGEYIVKSFDEFLLVLSAIPAISVLHTQIAHLTEHAHLSSQIRCSIAKLLNPPIQCTD